MGTHLTFLWFCVHLYPQLPLPPPKIILALVRKQCRPIGSIRRIGYTLREIASPNQTEYSKKTTIVEI
jgi:hypothetical protein